MGNIDIAKTDQKAPTKMQIMPFSILVSN